MSAAFTLGNLGRAIMAVVEQSHSASTTSSAADDTHGHAPWTPEREIATLVALMRCGDRATAVRAHGLFRWRLRQCAVGREAATLAMVATKRCMSRREGRRQTRG